MEGKMRLVRFDDWKTGLVVQLPIGLRVIDVIESLGAISLEAPIADVLNDTLTDRGSWGPLIEQWDQTSVGLRQLALLAAFSPHNSRLVIHRLDEIHIGFSSGSFNDVAFLDIAESSEVVGDTAWRERLSQQRALPPPLPPRADECEGGRIVRLDAYRRLKSDASNSAKFQ
jgi:hypothetical protein